MKKLALGALLLAAALQHPAEARVWGGQAVPTSGIPAFGDEFVGPFTSWKNAKTVCGAVGDGVADDTAAIQGCLNTVGTGSVSPVLWFPAGTYKITSTLTLTQRANVSLIGEDPGNTSLKWMGSAGGTLIRFNGLIYSRIDRITFDGNGGLASILVDQNWDGTQPWFDDGNQYADDVFKNAAYGIRGGVGGFGFADASILRGNFSNLTTAGIYTGNANALGVWARWSVFDHCNIGIYMFQGNANAYYNVFRNSTIAALVGGSDPVSARGNYSINDNRFYVSNTTLAQNNNTVGLTFQGNTVVTPVQADAYNISSQGPVIMYDEIAVSRGGAAAPIVRANSTDTDIVALGNTFTVASPFTVAGRLREVDTTVNPALPAPSEPTLPGVEPNFHRAVFEPTAFTGAAIQTAINNAAAAVGNRPVVHLPYGTYTTATGVSVPANSDLQLVGDGFNSVISNSTANLTAIVGIAGPTKTTVRELMLDNGNFGGDDIRATNLDQVGSRVFMEGNNARSAYNANVWSDSMDNTSVQIEDFIDYSYALWNGSSGLLVTGGPLAAAGTPAAGKTLMVSGNKTTVVIPYITEANGAMVVRDFWYESSPSAYFGVFHKKARVTLEGMRVAVTAVSSYAPTFDIADLDGSVSIFNNLSAGNVAVSGSGSNANVLVAGYTTDFVPASPYFVDTSSPAANSWLLESRQSVSGAQTNPTTNIGTITDANLRAMFAQARATTGPAVLTKLASGVSDLRVFRVWAQNSAVNFHFQGGSTPSPYVKLTPTPGSISTGGSSTLAWYQDGEPATSCVGAGFSTGGATSGSVSVSPTSTTKYSIKCTGATGLTGSAYTTVAVIPGGTEFVVNGTFESPASLAAPWDNTGSAANIVAANAHSPTHSVLFGESGFLTQAVQNLTPNTNYNLKIWARVVSGTCFGGIRNGVQSPNFAGSTYAQYTIPFTTGNVDWGLGIYGFCFVAGANANMDDFSVTLQ